MIMIPDLIDGVFDEMVALRRDIHMHPELSGNEKRTSALVAKKLREYGVDEVQEGITEYGTGVVALIRGAAGPGKCIAIRADMDALPLTEDPGFEFASLNPGVMHACCHDGHTAALLGAAKVLADLRSEFAGSVKLLFQPAEESAPLGGAKPMVDAGVMENPHVDAIIACHLTTSEQPGLIRLYKGEVTSSFDLFDIEVIGKSGHGSQPHTACDAILAASQYVVLLQQIVSRKIDPARTAIVSVGMINGGNASNIIAEHVTMNMVSRFFGGEARDIIRRQVSDLAKGVELLSSCKFNVRHSPGYLSVNNDPALIDLIKQACTEAVGQNAAVYMTEPWPASEDFSYYIDATGTPGALVIIDAGHCGDEIYPLHHPKSSWREESLKTAASFSVISALAFLGKL